MTSTPLQTSPNIAFEFVRSLAGELTAGKVDLPSFPEIAIRVRRVLSDPKSSGDQVVRVVGSEPALAARLMRIANSASLNRSGNLSEFIGNGCALHMLNLGWCSKCLSRPLVPVLRTCSCQRSGPVSTLPTPRRSAASGHATAPPSPAMNSCLRTRHSLKPLCGQPIAARAARERAENEDCRNCGAPIRYRSEQYWTRRGQHCFGTIDKKLPCAARI